MLCFTVLTTVVSKIPQRFSAAFQMQKFPQLGEDATPNKVPKHLILFHFSCQISVCPPQKTKNVTISRFNKDIVEHGVDVQDNSFLSKLDEHRIKLNHLIFNYGYWINIPSLSFLANQ